MKDIIGWGMTTGGLLFLIHLLLSINKVDMQIPIFGSIRYKIIIAWYDVWVGFYRSPKDGTMYFMIPFIGLVIEPSLSNMKIRGFETQEEEDE